MYGGKLLCEVFKGRSVELVLMRLRRVSNAQDIKDPQAIPSNYRVE
jgi:hypothetical protein